MRVLKYLLLSYFLSCASSFHPYQTEWRRSGGTEIFYAAITTQASEKAISADSVSMKQRTCMEAAKTISTSSKISKYLLDVEKMSLSNSEMQELGKVIVSYRITPVLVECQPGPKESLFGGVDWASCQCLYSIPYPGGRTALQQDIMKVK